MCTEADVDDELDKGPLDDHMLVLEPAQDGPLGGRLGGGRRRGPHEHVSEAIVPEGLCKEVEGRESFSFLATQAHTRSPNLGPCVPLSTPVGARPT